MSDTNTLNDLLPDSLNQEEQPNTQQPSLAKDDEILDMSGGFDFDDYQVVRREFFAHIKEPSVTSTSVNYTLMPPASLNFRMRLTLRS